MALYMYFAAAKGNAIIFLQQLSFFILYNILLKKLKSITISNTIFIKKQAYN